MTSRLLAMSLVMLLCWPLPAEATVNRIFASGSYTGTGAAASINTVFQPAAVFIFSLETTGAATNKAMSTKLSEMPDDDYSVTWTGNYQFNTTTGITITSTGFDLAAEDLFNESGNDFVWLAVRDGPWCSCLTYTGDGSDPLSVVLNRQVHWAVVHSIDNGGAGSPIQATNWASFDKTYDGYVNYLEGSFSFFQGPQAGPQMEIGTTDIQMALSRNRDGDDYYFFGLTGADSTQYLESDTYTAVLGGDDVVVTLGYRPTFVIVAINSQINYKTRDMPGDDAYEINAGEESAYNTGALVTITATGFTLGNAIWNDGTSEAFWLAGRDLLDD